jgi:hypothetical protein
MSRNEDFQCTKCTRKMNTAPMSTPLSTSSGYMGPSSPISRSVNQQDWLVTQNMCQIEGCNSPIVPNNSGINCLCKRHEVEQRHKNATARTQLVGVKAPPSQKPFDKKKLYPVKLDEELKSLKRKRPSYGKPGDADAEISKAGIANPMPSLQTQQGEWLTSPLATIVDQPQGTVPDSGNHSYMRGRVSGQWPPPPTAIDEDLVESMGGTSFELGIGNPA